MEDPLYREEILVEYRRAGSATPLSSWTHEADAKNPLCGDSLTVRLATDGGVIKGASVTCRGCVVSTVAAHRALGYIRGKTFERAREALATLPDFALFPAPLLSIRRRCATLILEALAKIL